MTDERKIHGISYFEYRIIINRKFADKDNLLILRVGKQKVVVFEKTKQFRILCGGIRAKS